MVRFEEQYCSRNGEVFYLFPISLEHAFVQLPYGTVDNILSRDPRPLNCHTEDKVVSLLVNDKASIHKKKC